jgi:FAD/FMN-containing dehydrogenase
MKKINSNSLARFADLLGPKGYADDPETVAPWLKDWRGLYSGKSPAILSPATTAEVADVIALASDLQIPLVPQGGNTSMVGGATPSPEGDSLILSLRRMNKVREIDEAAGQAVAEAGVILSNFHEAAAGYGMRFPLSLGAKGSATIGGLCSTNAGGTQVLRFGTMRRLNLGLEAVMPNGMIHSGLAALKKDTRGYDLNQLLIGAEGTLGVITAARLQLVPALSDRAVGWFGLESPARALDLLRFLERRTGDAVESFELMAQESVDLVLRHIPGTRLPIDEASPWHVLVELVTQKEGESASAILQHHAEAALGKGVVEDAALASSEAQAHAFWRIRESISEAERAEGPTVAHDISVPVDAMPGFIESAAAAVKAAIPGMIPSAFGHLGDGNVHFHVRADHEVDADAWRKSEGKRATRLIYDLVTAANGSISAEHGIGQMKRAELARLSSPAHLGSLRAIKGALDPLSIMNPGKLVPLASETPSA